MVDVYELWINPVIIWTFEFSQIVQSTMMLLAKPQLDLFLFKILGIELFLVCLVSTISILFYMLVKLSRNYTVETEIVNTITMFFIYKQKLVIQCICLPVFQLITKRALLEI